jgi:hypothetical protein
VKDESVELNKPYTRLELGKYFIEKGLIVLSRQPFFDQLRVILIDIRKSCQTAIKAPLEDYIAHFLYSVPCPPRGIASVNIKLVCKFHPYRTLLLKYPPINRLPYANNDFIIELFESLNVDNILLFFKRVLLDSNVIKYKLNNAIEFDGEQI